MYDNLIWGGCSFSFGSGFLDHLNDGKVKPRSLQISKDLNLEYDLLDESYAYKKIHQIIFPKLLSDKLKISNFQNLSMPGRGIENIIRRLVSYIETNLDNIQPTKTFIGIQLPPLVRIDLINSNYVKSNSNWNFVHLFNDGHLFHENAEIFFRNYHDFDYFLLKNMYHILTFHRYCKSLGIDVLYFGFRNTREYQMKISKYDIDKVYRQFVQSDGDYNLQSFPSIDNILEKINYFQADCDFESINQVYDGVDDAHQSVKGHQEMAEYIYEYLINSDKFKF
jgi:hypothetical protein